MRGVMKLGGVKGTAGVPTKVKTAAKALAKPSAARIKSVGGQKSPTKTQPAAVVKKGKNSKAPTTPAARPLTGAAKAAVEAAKVRAAAKAKLEAKAAAKAKLDEKIAAKAAAKAAAAAEKAAAKAAKALAKAEASVKASSGDGKAAGKSGRGKAAANAADEPALKPGEARLPPKKKGPIDLSTAKSVAAVAASTQADQSGYVIVNGRRVRMISTRGLPTPKRVKVVVEKEEPKPELQISLIKTKLGKKELDEYRALLLTKRRQLARMLSGMEDEALRSNGGNLSNMPLHMADIGTDTFDQDFTLGMAETERQLLDEIDAALARIENKTYGVCQLTGKPIPKTRLEAKPWAKYTVEAAKQIERTTPTR